MDIIGKDKSITNKVGRIIDSNGELKWFFIFVNSEKEFTFKKGDFIEINFPCCSYKGIINSITFYNLMENVYRVSFSICV